MGEGEGCGLGLDADDLPLAFGCADGLQNRFTILLAIA